MKEDRLLTLLAHWAKECERNKFWTKEDEEAYWEIIALIKKSGQIEESSLHSR